MFRFLKDKLKGAVKNFSRKTEEELLKESAEEEKFAGEVEKIEKTLAEQEPEKEGQAEKEQHRAKDGKGKNRDERTEETQPHSREEKREGLAGELQPETREEKKPEQEPGEKGSAVDSALEEIKSDLKGKSNEIQAEEKKRGVIGKIATAFKGKDGSEGNVLKRLVERITTRRISPDKFDGLFEELEMVLLENNVAVEVIDKIREDLRSNMVDKPVQGKKVEDAVIRSLKGSVEQLFDVEKLDLLASVRSKKPYTVMFAGINGSGKTTTIAKIVNLLQKNGVSCVVAASDTFRAAAIHQMQEHTDRLGVKLIKHDYGADPAAVAFDAKKYAEAKNVDVVLIDTAGRQHSNANLIDELKKIARVAKPDLKIFVGESITGNDCVNQASKFNEAIGIDGIVLAKADVDDKGGAAISISYVTKKPIIYLGTGQGYDDLTEFNPEMVVNSLGLAG